MKKVADKYANICGYRQHGLKYDDLIIEENETVQVVSLPRRRAQEAGRG
jgi:ubiquinol-cytochrome c reductase subunit 7